MFLKPCWSVTSLGLSFFQSLWLYVSSIFFGSPFHFSLSPILVTFSNPIFTFVSPLPQVCINFQSLDFFKVVIAESNSPTTLLKWFLHRHFLRHNHSNQQASGNKLRAAIDLGRKQYQPKQLKLWHFHCLL